MSRYAIEVFWSDEDEGYIATVPDLPGCSAFGETMADAASEAADAIDAWLSAAEAAGNPIPAPTNHAEFDAYSGKLLLRMPKELHRDLHLGAKHQGVSINAYVCHKLAQRHYHAEAVRDVVKSLQWQTFGFAAGGSTHHVVQLASVTGSDEPTKIQGSTADPSERQIFPLANFMRTSHDA